MSDNKLLCSTYYYPLHAQVAWIFLLNNKKKSQYWESAMQNTCLYVYPCTTLSLNKNIMCAQLLTAIEVFLLYNIHF